MHEAKRRLSELLRLVDGGQEIEISRGGDPIARIVPIHQSRKRELGLDEGVYAVPDDFDAPLPDVVLTSFEG